MGHHIDSEGRFQSDRHPELAPDKVVLSFQDERAHRALAALAEDYMGTDKEFGLDVMVRLMDIRVGRDLPQDPTTIVVDADGEVHPPEARVNRYLGPS